MKDLLSDSRSDSTGAGIGKRVGFFDSNGGEGDNEFKLIIVLRFRTSTLLFCNAVNKVSFSPLIRSAYSVKMLYAFEVLVTLIEIYT